MTLAQDPNSVQFLSDASPKDKPWDTHRAIAEGVAEHLISPGTEKPLWKLGKRIEDCAPSLFFNIAPDATTGEAKLKLDSAFFCRVRHCPVCAWRRSLMWKARFLQALPTVMEQHHGGAWVLLTLTVKNCAVSDLRETLTAMNKAWHRLADVRRNPELRAVLGWIRATEITRGADGSAHPHFHVLLFVRPSYFAKDYVSQAQWAKAWQKALKSDYTPVVDVRRVKASAEQVEKHGALASAHVAAAEVLKYAVKASDMLADKNWFLELVRQTHRTRAIASGGALKDVLRQHEETEQDLLLKEPEQEQEPKDEAPQLRFDYAPMFKRYARKREASA